MSGAKRVLAGAIAALLVSGVSVAIARRAPVDARAMAARTAEVAVLTRIESRLRSAGATTAELTAARAQIDALRASPATQTQGNTPDEIVVLGDGHVKAQPDVVSTDIGVSATATTVREAMARANRSMAAVVRALRADGIAERDIQTRWVSVGQECCSHKKPFVASNSIHAKLGSVSSAQHAIQDALDAGGDSTNLNGVGFSFDDPSAIEHDARDRAITDAHSKASQYAALVGRSLGPVISVSELPQQQNMCCNSGVVAGMAFAPEMAAPVPIYPGQSDTSWQVVVVYSLA